MLKLADNGTVKNVYSDTVGTHGRAEVMAFFVDYVQTSNPYAWREWVKEEKTRGLWYFETSGKYYDTVNQGMIDKFNKENIQNGSGQRSRDSFKD